MVSSWDALVAYCRATIAHRETERFPVLYLDLKTVLIADELQAKGTVDHVPIYSREVVQHALELNAVAFILVLNQTSGDPNRSDVGIVTNQQIKRAADALALTVNDCLIMGKAAELSFHASQLL